MPKRVDKWAREAFDPRKKGALSRQLGVPEKENIPITLKEKIVATPIGKRVHNPTQTGKRVVKVTRLLKQRTNAALNMQRARQK